MTSFFFYDFEAFGRDVVRDRPVAFAGVRTNLNFELIDDPVVHYCRPAPDYLPDPGAVLVHGISPLRALKEGIPEAEFARLIHEELSRPESCCLAYNGHNYDHPMTQHLLYRNLCDPYGWSWRSGCSRWDIIDLLRATFALRPAGMAWPKRDDGCPSFRLGDLAEANGIELNSAHDALEDVLATVELARLLKSAQPSLFSYALGLRSKRRVRALLDGPVVWVSSFLPGEHRCASLVAPICECPGNPNGVIVFDLRQDPSPFLQLSSDALRARLFTPRDELPDGVQRPALFKIKVNASPFLAKRNVLTDDVAERISIDPDQCDAHYEILKSHPGFAATVAAAYERDFDDAERDVDIALYDTFIPDGDRAILDNAIQEDPSLSNGHELKFQDQRLPELVFRFRSRSYWHTLSVEEKLRWQNHCRNRHLSCDENGRTAMDRYYEKISDLREERADDQSALALLDDCEEYGRQLKSWIG